MGVLFLRHSDVEEEERLLRWLAERMPSVEPKVLHSQRHPWTMTPDEDFIIDRVGSVVIPPITW